MTLDKLTPNRDSYWKRCNPPDPNYFEHSPIYNPLEPDIQPTSPLESLSSGSEEKSLGYKDSEGKGGGLSHVLERLSEKDIPGKEHLERYLRTMHRRGCRPNTLRNSLIAIETFLAFIKNSGKVLVDEITREDLGAFIEHEQDRGLKASTVQMRMRVVNAFIGFLAEDGLVHTDVLKRRMRIKVPDSLPRAIEPDDEKRLLSVIGDTRDRAMILLLLRTGMRIGELLNMRPRDVNFKERRIELFEAEKNRLGRVVYISDDAQDALKAWLKMRDLRRESLFYGMGRNTLSYGGARAMFSKYLKKAGLSHKGYTLHCLRHTNASELLNAGMRLECLKELLGHSSIEMTRRYARLTDRSRQEEYFKAMAKIERGEINGHYRLHCELQEILKEKELLSPHREELHEHP